MSKISQKLENKKLKFYINYFSIQNQKKKKKKPLPEHHPGHSLALPA